MSTVLVPIKNYDDIEVLRQIRNSCREFMTRDTSEISKEQQEKWYETLPDNYKIFLLYKIECGVAFHPIGYGLLKLEDEILISGGLFPQYRGKGYGSELFTKLILIAKSSGIPIKLEVLKSNVKAFVIYNKLGFRVTNDDGKVITMVYVNEE